MSAYCEKHVAWSPGEKCDKCNDTVAPEDFGKVKKAPAKRAPAKKAVAKKAVAKKETGK